MLKRVFLFFSLLSLFSFRLSASHLMGGEITWDCQGGGTYIFTMKLYRDCNGITVSGLPSITVTGHPTVTTIPLSLFLQTDISPQCNAGGPTISCSAAESQPGWPTSSSSIAGAVQESIFKSAPIALNGVPPASGWIFSYDECCRNPAITNLLSPGGQGFTLRAVMYAFNGMNAGPCFDSSPKFLESPSTVICLGYPFTYNHNAYDPERDSLSYSWAVPYTQIIGSSYNPPSDPAPFTFAAGYSFNSPLPGTAQNSANVPATINPSTGEISFTSFTQGNFVTVVKVEAWKCGQLVAEIYRELQIVLLPCAPNNPPSVAFSTFQDTVYAGDVVSFTLNATDPGFLADGVTPQTITVTATGNQFGSSFGTTGCANPPCASLVPAPPISGQGSVSTVFNWQTSCSHLSAGSGCNAVSNTYTFVFKTRDDFCPAPAENISTVSITVLALPLIASPQPLCVSVLSNGDVSLTWTPSTDPDGTFSAYMIYTSTSAAGPFTLLDSVLVLSQNNYIHVGANATTAPVYYYISTRSGCGALAAPADTVSSMKLSVANPADGTALLSWNTIASPPISSSSGIYDIYLEFPLGTWTLAGSTTATNFIDTVLVCDSWLNYRVEMADGSGCVSVSSADSGTFQNIIVPEIPVIDTLSVLDDNTAALSWNTNSSSDTEAYIIYRYNGSGWVAIDTVYGISSTYYNYLLSTAGAGIESFRLAAFDSCGNISPMGAIKGTMFLTASPDICSRSAILGWNPSAPLGTGLAGYNIFQSTTGLTGPYTLIGTASAAATSYTVSGLLASTMYYYKIQAFDLSGTVTSSSNRINFFSDIPIPPDFSYLQKVSVVDPNRVDVTCHVDVAASTQKYKIMRSLDNLSFQLVGVVPAGSVSPIVYSDQKVLTDKLSYYYKVINVDSCGFDGMETNIGRTILLSAVSNSELMTNTLQWNDYEMWLGNVISYNIYRGIDGVFDPVPIANVPYSGLGYNTYVDDISMLLQGHGVFNYYVEAQEGMGNIYGFAENSLSNVAEAYQEPKVFVPNAFRPGGVNSVFLPVTTYVNLSDYQLMIFNRWGLKVFESEDQYTGWDGTNNGVKQEFGVYVYLLRFKTSRGEHIELKGTVTLIR
jgi:gliding motility-associated-like protein